METTESQSVEPMMDVEGCAKYLNISQATVRAYVLNDTIPYRKVGRLVRFRRAEVDAWVEGQRGDERTQDGAA